MDQINNGVIYRINDNLLYAVTVGLIVTSLSLLGRYVPEPNKEKTYEKNKTINYIPMDTTKNIKGTNLVKKL